MGKIFRSVFHLFTKILSDATIQKRYVRVGGAFGGAVSYSYMGECVGFKRMLNRWARWEAEYIRRGYRAISLDDFIDYGGYGKELGELAGARRSKGEEPVLHAEIYRREFLGKIEPTIDLANLMQPDAKPQSGTYVLPSTKDVVRNR
ncbi:MAG: hypothetical protein Q8Q39_02495 [bacterium]|nr:hypothetical protein [bacterium]